MCYSKLYVSEHLDMFVVTAVPGWRVSVYNGFGVRPLATVTAVIIVPLVSQTASSFQADTHIL